MTQPPADALRELAPTGVLRVGIAVGPARSAMWTARDPATGRPGGVTVHLGAALAERLGVPAAFVEHGSSGEVAEAAARGTWDVAFMPVDAARKQVVDFGPNYFLGESTYLVPPGSPILGIEAVDRPGVRVVGVENTATLRTLRRVLRHAAAAGTATLDEAVAALRAGRADALALGRESLFGLAAQWPGARVLDGHFHAAGTAVAVPKGRPAALAYATAFIEAAKRDGTLRRAFDAGGMEGAAVAPAGSVS